ncbi:MAG: hypothetical protein ACNS64_08015 [Candidatus Halalkalibacterium sp. M3_1C_030]
MKTITALTVMIFIILTGNMYAQPRFKINTNVLNLSALESTVFYYNSVSHDKIYETRALKTDSFSASIKNKRLKNPKSALKRSIGHTTIPVGLSFALIFITNPNLFSDEGAGVFLFSGLMFMYGTTMGPSAGNLYARDLKRGMAGIVIRSLSWYLIFSSDSNSSLNDLGLIGLVGSALFNIATAPVSVKQYNRSVQTSIVPAINPKSGAVTLSLKIRL